MNIKKTQHKLEAKLLELQKEYKELMPEDFESKAAIEGELRGMGFVFDLITANDEVDSWVN